MDCTRADIHIFQYDAPLVSKRLIMRSCTLLKFCCLLKNQINCSTSKYAMHLRVCSNSMDPIPELKCIQ